MITILSTVTVLPSQVGSRVCCPIEWEWVEGQRGYVLLNNIRKIDDHHLEHSHCLAVPRWFSGVLPYRVGMGRRSEGEGIPTKGCEEKHSHTAAHHPVVKPPAVYSTAVSHTPTQQQWLGKLLGTILEYVAT